MPHRAAAAGAPGEPSRPIASCQVEVGFSRRCNIAQLEQMARSGLIGDIAVGVSHKINQPLAIISMGLQNL